jgi:hypothetical protein
MFFLTEHHRHAFRGKRAVIMHYKILLLSLKACQSCWRYIKRLYAFSQAKRYINGSMLSLKLKFASHPLLYSPETWQWRKSNMGSPLGAGNISIHRHSTPLCHTHHRHEDQSQQEDQIAFLFRITRLAKIHFSTAAVVINNFEKVPRLDPTVRRYLGKFHLPGGRTGRSRFSGHGLYRGPDRCVCEACKFLSFSM